MNWVNTKICIYFFALIRSYKWVDTIELFNKQVVLGFKNPNPFIKRVRLVLTNIVEYLWVNMKQIWHVNTNYHPYQQIFLFLFFIILPTSFLAVKWLIFYNNITSYNINIHINICVCTHACTVWCNFFTVTCSAV